MEIDGRSKMRLREDIFRGGRSDINELFYGDAMRFEGAGAWKFTSKGLQICRTGRSQQ
jgi:hypothetical protein